MKRILSLLTFILVLIIFLSSCSTGEPDITVDGGDKNGNPEQLDNGEDNTKPRNNSGDKSSGGDTEATNNFEDQNNKDKSYQEGVEVEVSVPLHVDQGSQFEITLQVKNNTSKEQKLKEIKIDKEYLEAVAIIKTEPNYKNVSESLFSDQKNYEFQVPINSHEKIEFKFYAEAIKKGRYIPNFDVDTTYELSSLHKEINAFID